MANRYWVGGTGNINDTAHWSTTSGGAGGASVPTSVDDVFFDTGSDSGTAFIVTWNAAWAVNNYTVTTTDFLMTAQGAGAFSVYGNWSTPATNYFRQNDGSVTFAATTTGKTITTNGVQPAVITNWNGVGGEWTLQDNFSCSLNVCQLVAGTLNTNGKTVTLNEFQMTGAGVKTLTLGASTLTVLTFVYSGSNFTLNAGTSTVNIKTTLTGGAGLTFYDVVFNNTAVVTIAFSGANTFNNLTFLASTSGTKTINFANNQVINGTLTTTSTTPLNRVQYQSSVAGTQRTLTASSITTPNSDYKDIAIAGAASPYTAPFGDNNLGNNTGITFNTQTAYWIGNGGSWIDGTHWSLTSGGSAVNAIPGSTNNVVIDTSSGTGNITCVGAVCADLTVTATQAITLGQSASTLSVYGSLTFPSGGSFSVAFVTGTITFAATTTGKTITTNGKQVNANIVYNGVGGGWTLGGDFTHGTNNTTWTNGTFNTGNFNIQTYTVFTYSGTGTATINLGSSTLFGSSSCVWNFSNISGLTFNAGTSTIQAKGVSVTFNGGGLTYYNVSVGYTSGGFVGSGAAINGANTFTNLTLINTNNITACAWPINILGNQTVTGTFSTSTTNIYWRVWVKSATAGTQYTITAAATSLSNIDFSDIVAAGVAAPFSGTSIGNAQNNSSITFDTPKTVYWNLSGAQNWSSNAWATSSGGTPVLANFPLPQDTIIFDNTGSVTGTITLNSNWNLGTINMSGRTSAMTLAIPAPSSGTNYPTVFGNWTTGTGVTLSDVGNIYFSSRTTQTITSNGMAFTQTPIVNTPSGTVSLGDALSAAAFTVTLGTLNLAGFALNNTGAFTFTAGTVNLANATLTTGTWVSNNSNTRAVQFGTGNITTTTFGAAFNVTGTNLTYTGTPTVNISNSGATATAIAATSFTETNAFNFNITTGTYALTFSNPIVKNLNFTGFGGTVNNSTRTIYGNLTIPASGVTFTAGVSGFAFSATSGTQLIDTNGVTLDIPITQNGTGGTVQLVSDLVLGSTRTYTYTAGTLNANGKNITVGLFSSAAGNVRTLNMGSGAWTLSGTGSVWNISNVTNLTINPSTSTIVLSDTSVTARTFVGGGQTYNNLTIGGTTGTSTLNFTGSNTFNTLSSTKTVAHTILFTASTTNTFTNFNINGTVGNVVTIGSITAASHTLAKAGGGTVTVDYASISYSTATPTLTWLATNSTNGGNNSGWYFGAFPALATNTFFLLF